MVGKGLKYATRIPLDLVEPAILLVQKHPQKATEQLVES